MKFKVGDYVKVINEDAALAIGAEVNRGDKGIIDEPAYRLTGICEVMMDNERHWFIEEDALELVIAH